jgi:hypothetical protein
MSANDTDVWINWTGDACPVPQDTMVEVILRDGEQARDTADCFYWTDCGRGKDVIGYRVIK